MIEYTSKRYIDGKVRQAIVDKNGKIINRNPSKDELKGLEEEPRSVQDTRKYSAKYKVEELLNELILFKKKYGRYPTREDFRNNPDYPDYQNYRVHFGSWSNALKIVGMDLDARIMQGYLKTNQEKARLAEIKVINHFKQHPVDLAGKNCLSPYDGICPNGMNYDVKSSKLCNRMYYQFGTNNRYKDEIEIYYFLAFNEDYSKLKYAWRVPGEIVEKDNFYVILNPGNEFTIDNMKRYDITDKFKKVYEE